VVLRSTLYDGWRHLLFIYPPLVIVATAGWRHLLQIATPRLSMAVVAFLAVGCAEPLLFIIMNHPNEAVYFNTLAGGPRGAAGRFELDYGGNSLLQAVEWSADLARNSRVPLVITGRPYRALRANVERFPGVTTSPLYAGAHHMELRLLRAETGPSLASRRNALYVVRMADGTPVAVVLPGPRFKQVRNQLGNLVRRAGPNATGSRDRKAVP
jgi:hypothetical protein